MDVAMCKTALGELYLVGSAVTPRNLTKVRGLPTTDHHNEAGDIHWKVSATMIGYYDDLIMVLIL